MIFFDIFNDIKYSKMSLQEVVQSAETTPNEAEVTSSNLPPPSCADMSKRLKKKI
jgi:hypothetical protein